ncbi:MAG TPA: molybdenum cofactor guanylyltransferase [Candidatus Marinimicrobia bacterium]|nr:molybdenum cofactor guanylyltransferase [Candidatus Neomarinimicrobiota bacterium]HIB34173.1 molybdenum cofactor guanylyltransferase [Candidatus Neomarinimicrobiota bacterium]
MNHSRNIPISAFILIGGKSERFGSEKWRANINGKSVLDRIWDGCMYFEERIVIGKEKPKDFKKPFICDQLEIQAPINGLYTAIQHAEDDWIQLVSCDLPLIDTDVFQILWNTKTQESDAVIPLTNNRHQVTCALYHKRILNYLESAIYENDFSLLSLIKNLKITKVNFNSDKRFWNMNTKKNLGEISNYLANKL